MKFVDVPSDLEKHFLTAEQYVSAYFQNRSDNPEKAEILIGGRRYILVRAEGFRLQFIEAMKEVYSDEGSSETIDLARGFLYDLAFAMGKADAQDFHQATGVQEPIEKLSTGPIHFAFTGWARVHLSPESNPSPDENYILIFDHPNSFESGAWIKQSLTSDVPVCLMNSGYSAGWCSVSFDQPLVTMEVACRAAGDNECRFIMAHRDHLEERLEDYYRTHNVRRPQQKPLPLRLKEIRKRHKKARRDARMHLLANDASGESVTIFDEEGRVTYVNHSTMQMFGYSGQELIGAGVEWLAKGESLATLLAKTAWSGERELRRKDGSLFPAHVTTNPIPGEKGEILGTYLIIRDITPLKEAEKKQNEAERRLNEAIHEHSLAMSRSSRLLTLSEMTTAMAHQLNQPLGGILNYLRGCEIEIQNGITNPTRIIEGLERIPPLVNRATETLHRLRSIANPSDSKAVSIHLGDVLDHILDMLRPSINKTQIEVEIDLPPDAPPLRGQPLRIEQVLTNLIINACDAMEVSEKKLLGIKAKPLDTGFMEIEISDSGMGIEEDVLSKIFEPFYSTKEEERGLGLGLAISARIVKEHGGKITAVSEPDKGTEMTELLPLEIKEDD